MNEIAGHKYVDLGLSVMWATCNVGASSPEEYGDYFAWGETSPKSSYTDITSKTNKRGYCGDSSCDAARANWGGKWRLPTEAEMQELVDKCTWTWTCRGYTHGYRVTSKINGNSIFLPAAGHYVGAWLNDADEQGEYWASTPYEYARDIGAFYIYFDSSYHHTGWFYRTNGFSVRPVFEYSQEISGIINGHAYVDLGLSVKWATMNVGASSPSDYGDYFAWGETSPKSSYNGVNCITSGKSGYEDIAGDASLDAARANWGANWRLPTKAEAQELVDKCTWMWNTRGGKSGYEVTGPNGNSIFLPAAGARDGLKLFFASRRGSYFTSTCGTGTGKSYAYFLSFSFSYHQIEWLYRTGGFPVRPVAGY